MPLRQVLNSIDYDEQYAPIGVLLTKLARGISDAQTGAKFAIWLAEESADDEYFFYCGSKAEVSDDTSRSFSFKATENVKLKMDEFSTCLQNATGRKSKSFFPIHGTRFGQKSEHEYLKPTSKLVGALEMPLDFKGTGIEETAQLCAMAIWNHRSRRFLRMENDVDGILKFAKERSIDWRLIEPLVMAATHSDRFAVLARKKGEITDRLDGSKTLLGLDFYVDVISKNRDYLDSGGWKRSVNPSSVEDGTSVFWMLVPLKTPHFLHNADKLSPSDRVQHYICLETIIRSSEAGRFMYSSADRRLVEHSLTKFLEGIAEFRIDEVAHRIVDCLPEELPQDPTNATSNFMREICNSVYDVSNVFIINPAMALHSYDSNASLNPDSVIFASDTIKIDKNVLEELANIEIKQGTFMNAKHVEVIDLNGHSGLVFSVGTSFTRRYIVYVFNEPYSSYVSTEICSRLAARIHLFLQSCDLQNERTASLTQIAHVLRGPVSSALEEIRGIIRDRKNPPIHSIVYEGAMSEDDKLLAITNWLARSRSLTDSAKYLLGALGPSSFQRRKVDLLSVYNEVRSLLEVERKQKNISIIMRDHIAREKDETAYVWGDEDLLWLLIYNLLENAIKYGRRNSEVIVTFFAKRISEDINISFENTGDLIWDFDKERIFVAYQRALNSLPMNGKEGTGIGLPAAKQVALAFNPDNKIGIELSQDRKRTEKQVTGKISFSTRLIKAY